MGKAERKSLAYAHFSERFFTCAYQNNVKLLNHIHYIYCYLETKERRILFLGVGCFWGGGHTVEPSIWVLKNGIR